MMKAAFRVALALSLVAVAATSVQAIEPTGPDDQDAKGVRVVNNYGDLVRVYAVDAGGHLHKLGRVASGQLVEFEIPEDIAGEAFRIKIFPGQPVWSPRVDDYAVKTNPLNLNGDTDVTVWVEPELTHTVVEMSRG